MASGAVRWTAFRCALALRLSRRPVHNDHGRSVPALRVVTHRADEYVTTRFSQIEGLAAQQGIAIPEHTVERDNEWRFHPSKL